MAKKLLVNEEKITAVADAIRTKTNTTDKMTLDDMPTKISGISSGGGSLVTNPLPKPLSYIDYNTNTLYIWPHPLCGLFGADEWVDLTINGKKIPWTEFDKFRPVNNMDNNSSHATSIAGDTINFGDAGIDNTSYPKDYHIGTKLGRGDYMWIYTKGQGTTDSNIQLLTQSEYVIPKVKGNNSIKIKYKARNITEDNPKKITVNIPISPYENKMQANTIGNGLPEQANYTGTGFDSKISANLFTDSPEISYNYTLNEYNINLNNINYDGLTTDILYKGLSISGTLYAYDKSIAYTFDTSRSGNEVTSSSNYYKIADIDGDNIIANFDGYDWNNVSYVKILFTLTETKNVSINYIFNKASSDYQYDGIFFGAIDKTMSITYNSYSSKSGITNCIYYAGDGSGADEKISTNDTSVHTYTYENVPAGKHYIQLRFYAYSYYPEYRPKITVTPVYEKTDTGKYLPSNITVTDTDTNEVIPDTEYEYSPYTGKFTIPMTHNWNMTAEASTLQLSPEVSPEILYSIDSSGNRKISAVINDKALISIPIDIEMNGISQGSIKTSPRGYGSKTLVPNINGENILKVRSNVSGKQPGGYASRQFWFNATDKPLSRTNVTEFGFYQNGTWDTQVYNGYWGNDGVYRYYGNIVVKKGNSYTTYSGSLAEINPETNEKIRYESIGSFESNSCYINDEYVFGTDGYAKYDYANKKMISMNKYSTKFSGLLNMYYPDYYYTKITNAIEVGDKYYLFVAHTDNRAAVCFFDIVTVDLKDNSTAKVTSSFSSYLPTRFENNQSPSNVSTLIDNSKSLIYVICQYLGANNRELLDVYCARYSINNNRLSFVKKFDKVQTLISTENSYIYLGTGISPDLFTVNRINNNKTMDVYRCSFVWKYNQLGFEDSFSVKIGDGNNEYETYSSNLLNNGSVFHIALDPLCNRYITGPGGYLNIYIK